MITLAHSSLSVYLIHIYSWKLEGERTVRTHGRKTFDRIETDENEESEKFGKKNS